LRKLEMDLMIGIDSPPSCGYKLAHNFDIIKYWYAAHFT